MSSRVFFVILSFTMNATRSFFFLFPACSRDVSRFASRLNKSYAIRQRVKFLKQCRNEQVLPKSLLPVRLRKLSYHLFDKFSCLVFDKHIELTMQSEHNSFKELRTVRQDFHRFVPPDWNTSLMDSVYSATRHKLQRLEEYLRRKLKTLIFNSDWTQNSDTPSVINLSSKHIDNTTRCALGYGLSFSEQRPPSAVEVSSAFVYLEQRSNVLPDVVNIARGAVYSAVFNKEHYSVALRYIKCIEKLKKDNSLHISKADKSNTVVIMDKWMYMQKMNELLSDTETYTKLRTNPQDNVIKTFNSTIKNILKNRQDLSKKFRSEAPPLPYMYGVAKTHKPNNPLRPIISSVASASYKLAKWLAQAC